MSLQIWFPLNGTMKNQGLLGDLTETTSPTFVDGKMGKALSSGGCKMTAEQTPKVLNNDEFSICFWIYVNDAEGSTDNRYLIFGNDAMNQRQYSLFQYPSVNDLHWSWYNAGAASVLGGVLPSYTWTHVAITYKNPNATIYINGEKTHTFTSSSTSDTYAYETPVIHNNSAGTRYFNDYRVYNNCLSAKEVKEISKGLILHYKLGGYGGENLALNSAPASTDYWTILYPEIWSKETVDCAEAPLGKCIRVTYTGSTTPNGGIYNSHIGRDYFVDAEAYTISCYARSNFDGLIITLNNEMQSGHHITLSPEWTYYTYTGTISQSSTYSANVFYVVPASLSSGDYFEIHSLKIERGTKATSWTPCKDDALYSSLGFNSGIEKDCSGFGNDGTLSGNILWDSESIRHEGSYRFDESAYINCGTGAKVTDEITVNVWCYMDTWEADPHPFSCTEGGGWNFESQNGQIKFPVYVSGSGYIVALSSKLWSDLSSGWHMFTGTYDGLTAKLYIDGNLEATASTGSDTKTAIGYHSTNAIFIHAEAMYSASSPTNDPYKACKMSDARIYATALSESDVKSLYDNIVSIDKNGNIHAYDFKED